MSRHIVIPDCQVKPGVPTEHLRWAGEHIAKKRPNVIIQIGDFADMPSLSSYDTGKKSFEGRRYKKDVEAVREAMQVFLKPFRKIKGYRPRMVLTLGNHEDRISRAIESDPKLDGTISLDDLGYKEAGWQVYPFLEGVTIDGIIYSHYFPSGQLGRPCTSARAVLSKHHMSCIAGHQQGRDIAYGKRADGRSITAIIAGSFYQHTESYLNPMTNQHWRGIYMLYEVKDGSFDELPVSMNYLRRKYGSRK